MAVEHVDVLIVGAGLSGIGAGYHLQKNSPGRTYAILEGRDCIGGTWDLFRYPGIRSDSDMYTLGYSFRPWKEAKAIADGPSILKYVRDTAAEYGIDRKIKFHHMVKRADWDSAQGCWTVEAERGPERELVRMTCNFLFMCSGYYDYQSGYLPEFPGIAQFGGTLVHPQKWPENLDYEGKSVLVIGSGATAMTLVPAMAEKAGHVTMLQRSPTYVVSRPAEDKFANWLRRHLPSMLAYQIVRWRNVLTGMYYFRLARKYPARVKQGLIDLVQQELGADYDVKTHFTPRYNPWDQRVCLVPDSDLFGVLKSGKASVVTDEISTFTESGVALKSGRDLQADIVVTATGLKMLFIAGLQVRVDGELVDFSKRFTYKGMMYNDVPNLATSFGYTNASWTLKCDLTCEYVCRLLNHMDQHNEISCTPRMRDGSVEPDAFLDFTSGYVMRAREQMPKQGKQTPWRVHQNYARDLLALRFGAVEDGVMQFAKKKQRVREAA